MPPVCAITVPGRFWATVPVKTVSAVTAGEPQHMPRTSVDQNTRPVAGSSAVTRRKSDAPM